MEKLPVFINGPYRHQSKKALVTFIHDLEVHRSKYKNADEAIERARQILAEREAQGVIKDWEDDAPDF